MVEQHDLIKCLLQLNIRGHIELQIVCELHKHGH